MSIKLKSGFGLKGQYRIVKLKTNSMLTAFRKAIGNERYLKLYKTGLLDFLVKEKSPVISNLIVFNEDHGLNLFIQHLAGLDFYPLHLDSASIGTGTTEPTDADTDLETPVVEDIPRATVDLELDRLTTEWFITNDELPTGTYTEFGLKAGTQLFCRSIISPSHTKAANEDTLVEYVIIGSNSLVIDDES